MYSTDWTGPIKGNNQSDLGPSEDSVWMAQTSVPGEENRGKSPVPAACDTEKKGNQKIPFHLNFDTAVFQVELRLQTRLLVLIGRVDSVLAYILNRYRNVPI
jgi:hypothetical protein